MKVGNLVNGLAVVDVKRITSLNLTAFTRDIVKYLDEGYRIDVSSTREVGLQKRVDMFKVEDNKKDVEVKVTVGKTEMVEEINDLYQENWSVGKNLLYKRSKINPDKFQVKIVSPFESGYLDSVNYKKLEKITEYISSSDVGVFFENAYQKPIVGEFIMKDTTTLIVLVFSEELQMNQILRLKKEIGAIVSTTFKVKLFRSHTQDVNFGVRKLVDIAIKAISPAVNDPTTCLNCIDQIGEIAKELAIREFPSTDSRTLGSKKIQVNEFNFEEFIDFCYDQIFQWGKEDPTVVKRIIRSIRIILPLVENPFNLKILIQQVEEMDLLEIYNLSQYKKGKLKISKEKLVIVERELFRFRQKAKLQIKTLELKGVLNHYKMILVFLFNIINIFYFLIISL